MGNVLIEESSLQAIADAIREKNESQATYRPSEMAPAISALDNGWCDAYKYYRLYITAFKRSSYPDKNQTHQNIARFCVIGEDDIDLAREYGIAYTAISNYNGNPPSSAFDGKSNTFWETNWSSAKSETGWLQVELDEARPAKGFGFTVRFSTNGWHDFPSVAVVQGSYDGSTWTDLLAFDESTISIDEWIEGKLFVLLMNRNYVIVS